MYHVTHRVGAIAQRAVLLLASWAFYAWWDARLLPLLLGSIAVNYIMGRCIAASIRSSAQTMAGRLMVFGIALNIALIGVFKYANFFVDSANSALGTGFVISAVIL